MPIDIRKVKAAAAEAKTAPKPERKPNAEEVVEGLVRAARSAATVGDLAPIRSRLKAYADRRARQATKWGGRKAFRSIVSDREARAVDWLGEALGTVESLGLADSFPLADVDWDALVVVDSNPYWQDEMCKLKFPMRALLMARQASPENQGNTG